MKKAFFLLTILSVFLTGCSAPVATDVQQETDLDAITEKYVVPLMPSGRILVTSWATPEELDPSLLVDFCSYNNLLDKEVTPSNSTIAQGAEYIDHIGPADEVEKAIRQYFDISIEHLRSAPQYGYEKEGVYFIGHGYGGGRSVKALDAISSDSELIITVGVYGPDDLHNPALTGILTISLSGGDYKYISYALE